ncbi:unnamed protein product, partial [Plutella xylostella]
TQVGAGGGQLPPLEDKINVNFPAKWELKTCYLLCAI